MRINVEIRGVTALLIHRFGEDAEQGKPTRAVIVDVKDPRTEAEKVVYKDKQGHYYFGSDMIPSSMGNAGANHKLKGSRKSLRFIVPSAVRVEGETVTILNGNGPAKGYEVDSRPVTIPSTRGRVMRHRPRFDNWGARFTLVVNENLISAEMAHKLLEQAGEQIGIGDFRPQCRGPFGTFRVVKFEEVK